MGTLTLLVFLLLAAKAARDATPAAAPPAPSQAPMPAPSPAALPAPAPAAPALTPAAYHPAPWPQVVPSGLPPFPGSGWVPAQPPGAAVVARAWQLLSQLWASGPGTFKTEQTDGRWITYRATPMPNNKKGVVAYRIKPGAYQGAPMSDQDSNV